MSLKICCILLKFSPFSMLPTSRAWNLRINLYRLDIVGWQVRVMYWCLLLFLRENSCTWEQFLILTGEHFQIKSCTLKERFYEAFSEKPKNCYTYSPSREIVLVQNQTVLLRKSHTRLLRKRYLMNILNLRSSIIKNKLQTWMRFIYNDIKTVDGVGERETKTFLELEINLLLACLLDY